MRWERLKEGLGGPGKRWGHTCNSVKGGSFLYVFGGYDGVNSQTNQVHVFDTAKQTWSQPTIKGLPPDPRDSHTCTTVGDNLYIFGGTDGLDPFGDLHILDTVSHTWISPSVRGDGPEAREGHSAALVGTRLFIFGGRGKSLAKDKQVYYNNLYVLNTETLVWKHVVTSGNPPCARDNHTCSSWNYKMIVIGGEDENDYYLSDVHVLDAETLAWKELITTGQKLPPRAGHSTVALGKHLFVFGGFSHPENPYNDVYMLDVDSAIWTKLATTRRVPSARFFASGDCLDPAEFGVLVFFGGCSKTFGALGDMYYLHTGLSGVQDEQRPKKRSLRKRASAEVGVVMSNGDFDSKPKVSRITSEDDAVDLMQINSVHVKEEPTTDETISEEAASNPDPSVAPSLNLNDVVCADVPASGEEDRKEMDKMAKDSNTLPAVEDNRTPVAEVQTDPGTSARGVNID